MSLMIAIHRAHGLRIVMFTDDHEPARVRVFGDGHAEISLSGRDDARELLRAVDVKRKEVPRNVAFLPNIDRRSWRDGETCMADLTNAEIDAARCRGQQAHGSEPRAIAARYDSSVGRVIVELQNGCTFAFPPALAQGLETASDEQLASVEILGRGYGLHWEELDVDLTLPGLMAGIFGTKTWMARQGGRSTSPAKAATSRSNGAKGGSPRKEANR